MQTNFYNTPHHTQCFDPDTAVSASNDYECRCVSPATGTAVSSPAACTYVGECRVAANAQVCTDAGQTCVDPDRDVDGDWQCRCVLPQSGAAGMQQAAAACGTDECTATCATCENGVCSAAAQACEDPDVQAPGNWVCRCVAPQTGADGAQAAATCAGLACRDMDRPDNCTAEPLCMWDPVVKCTDVRTEAPGWYIKCAQHTVKECRADPLCHASDNGGCTNECEELGSEDPCATNEKCTWLGAECVMKREGTPSPWALSCANRTQEACAQDPACNWANDKCVATEGTPAPGDWGMRCQLHAADEPSCKEDPSCAWNGVACESVCPASQGQAACEAKACLWTGEQTCVPPGYAFQCVKYRGEPSCAKDPRCLWDAAEAQCYFQCEAKTESRCEDDARCLWKPASADGAVPAKCFQRKCAMFEQRAPCESERADCEWVANTTCVSKCDARATSAACTVDAACVWDATRTGQGQVPCTPVEVPPEHGLCAFYKKDEAACNDDIRCSYDAEGSAWDFIAFPNDLLAPLCKPIALGGWTPTPTEWGGMAGAPPGEGDDDDCWWCWLLLALLLLCCSCCILAFLLLRKKQNAQATEKDDERWNHQFEAQVDEDFAQSNPRSPHKEGEVESEHTKSLLYGEEMSDKATDEKPADDDTL